jgi:hypothetical protein
MARELFKGSPSSNVGVARGGGKVKWFGGREKVWLRRRSNTKSI